MVWRYVIALFFSLKISVGDDLIISIRANTTQNFNSESWNINMQQCLHQNVESCQILIQEGLKTEEQCHAKKECSLIGEIYWNANYFTQALSFFKKSCDGKNMQGCYFLGIDYEKKEDFKNAKDFFQIACAKKNMNACFKLGDFYNYGKGVRQDYEQAGTLYKKACKYEHAQACYNVGILYQEGHALIHDLSLAKEFYGKSCDLGFQKGCDEYRKLNQAGIPSLYSNKNVF